MPTLSCKSNTIRSSSPSTEKETPSTERKISKLIDKYSAEVEFELSKRIAAIPLWKNYFVISDTICHPTVNQRDPEFKDCELLEDHRLSDMRVLTMAYRGDSLYTHRFNMSSFQFLPFMKHVLEAGSLMAIFGIVHRDLHLGNYLVDSYHIPRIIDFNLSLTIHQSIRSSFLSHSYDPSLLQEPPDSTLVNAISLGYSYDRIIPSIIKKKSILKKLQVFFRKPLSSMEAELFEFYESSKSAKAGNTEAWFRSYWNTIDSWAIGVMLVDMIVKFMNWKDFVQAYQEHKKTIEPILRKMCEINPMNRIDCVRALQLLDPQNFILRKYGNKWLMDTTSVGGME